MRVGQVVGGVLQNGKQLFRVGVISFHFIFIKWLILTPIQYVRGFLYLVKQMQGFVTGWWICVK